MRPCMCSRSLRLPRQCPDGLDISSSRGRFRGGVDVINLSLGGIQTVDSSWPILETLKSRGIAVIVAAGNDGTDYGPFFPSSPATDPSVLAVGSVSSISYPTVYNAVDTDGKTVQYSQVTPLQCGCEFHSYFSRRRRSGCRVRLQHLVGRGGDVPRSFQGDRPSLAPSAV